MRASELLFSLLKQCMSDLGLDWPEKAVIEPPREKKFGDLAANCALAAARTAGRPPRALAEELAQRLRAASSDIAAVEVAGPGFLNVTFAPSFWQSRIVEVEEKGPAFGSSEAGRGVKAQVEFVSANPTGPLHIGHGRGAAVGDSIARILRFAGCEVESEYYINDAGRQMRMLGKSIRLRLMELAGKAGQPFPDDCYKGGYIIDIARDLLALRPELPDLPEDEAEDICYAYGLEVIFTGIKEDLRRFNVHHDVWFSEKSLVEDGTVERTLEGLKAAGLAREEDGALWFDSERFGDDKNRVLRKSDGTLTYFASDIAYHANKYGRGFTSITDVWGADHHGYVARMRAAVAALRQPPESFDVVLVQLVNLLQDGEQIAMSTRAGAFETLADVLREVGVDAARFMFLSRKSDSKLDFDLSLVRQRSMDNPVYYVQYAHARVQALLRKAAERGFDLEALEGDLFLLTEAEELDMLRELDRFESVVRDAAAAKAPHFISYFLMELAGLLHRHYARHQVLGADDRQLAVARLRLLRAVGQCVKNGLDLLGVSAPDSM
ncbi:arginine--tRNA ligase [Desulfovibrio sp. OttesenSCG-928-G11]|nr:arginine--tRNA ligase [Desulfovibrio sp. OttesenSCG-928-G11]